MPAAHVIGSGPNGLSAAIKLAQAGFSVEVFEAQEQIGGAARTLPLTLPGFCHDFGSAVHPMAAGSPFFSTLPLGKHGLRWIHSPAVLAHPFDDGSALIIEGNLKESVSGWGEDGKRWRELFAPFAGSWEALAEEFLGPVVHIPSRVDLLVRFAMVAMQPASFFARYRFRSTRVRGLFAGLAAHSALSLDAPASAAAGFMLAIAMYGPAWPVPEGGAQSISNALAGCLRDLQGVIHTSRPIADLDELPAAITFCDLSPHLVERIAGRKLSTGYRKKLLGFRRGPGAFKIDYALSEPIPWQAVACARAATVHLGATLDEIALSEKQVTQGEHAERPFVLLSQPSLFDPTRAPAGKHIAWAYCHVPNGSGFDMTQRIEAQIERFAPGFRSCILSRRVSRPADLEAGDANLSGGDILGGAMDLRQTIFRPTLRNYSTSNPNIFICSASTPPGGGVHGMCGYHAAQAALRRLRL